LAQILRREIRSFFQRIRWLLESELYLRGILIGFQALLGLTREESMHAVNAYSEDSNSLYARFPWMTLVDERISVEAWTKGAAWAYRNARSGAISLEQAASEDFKHALLYDKLNWRGNCTAAPKQSTLVNLSSSEAPEPSRCDP